MMTTPRKDPVAKASVIVSTYNQPAFLGLVLLSLRLQSRFDFEVVVADDGSGEETRCLVQSFVADSPYPLRHVWQEDDGFRKPAILNQAVRASTADYLIFNDGDCLAHRHFVRGHLGLSRSGSVLVGRTPRLGRELTEGITRADVERGSAQRITLGKVLDYLRGRTTKLEFGVYVGNDWLFRQVQKTKKTLELWGGNFSCWKTDYVKVNGFNEQITGWGKEDDEIGVRFRNAGLQVVSVANRAVNFHLWHPKGHRVREVIEKNMGVKKEFQRSGEYRCQVGYDRE